METHSEKYVMDSKAQSKQDSTEIKDLLDTEIETNLQILRQKSEGKSVLSIDTTMHPSKHHHAKSPTSTTAKSAYSTTMPVPTTNPIISRSPTSPISASILGNIIMRKKGSIAFFIDLLSPDKHFKGAIEGLNIKLPDIETNENTSPRSLSFPATTAPIPKPIDTNVRKMSYSFEKTIVPSFEKIRKDTLRTSPDTLKSNLEQKMEAASAKRQRNLQQRRLKLFRDAQSIKYRMLIHESRQRLEMMRLQAKMEYSKSSAELNRQIHLRKIREQFGNKVEHAKRVMLIQKMHKFMDLRKALSENFGDFLKDDYRISARERLIMSPLGLNVTLDDDDYDSHDHTFAIPSDEESDSSPVKKMMVSDATRSSYYESPKPKEALAASIKRTKSLPELVLKETDDLTFLELLSLLPPVTRFTLRELDMDEILGNAQLRHDITFDADLQFKPSTELDENGDPKQDDYWIELDQEIKNNELYRIPLLLAEVRAIIIELVPNGLEIKEEVMTNIDVNLIAQQIEHGIMNPQPLIEYIANIMKTNCAPIRDPLVDNMVQACKEGDILSSLKSCFEILELMKLDYANHQLTRLRPHILEHAVAFEWRWFRNQFDSGQIKLDNTKKWLKQVWKEYKESVVGSPNPAYDLFPDALLHITQKASCFSTDAILPETLQMDMSRLVSVFNSWQDITILVSILIVFKQFGGPKCTDSDLLEAKKSLWILLNDSDSSIAHVTLQMGHMIGRIRGSALTPQEQKQLNTMTENSLAPNSKLYEIIQKRVGIHLRAGLNAEPLDKDLLKRHAMVSVEKEIEDVIKKFQAVANLNKAVYGKLYMALLDDIKNGVESPMIRILI